MRGHSTIFLRHRACLSGVLPIFADITKPAAANIDRHTKSMTRTGVFVGSFDPFTVGHASVVSRALPLFDRLVIGVGVNEKKRYMLTAEERTQAITRLYKDEPRVEVRQYGGLTTDFARTVGALFIVKGVRSIKDFEYEREQADINRMMGLETLLLVAEPQMASISSSMVRELAHFGHDIAPFVATKSTTDTLAPQNDKEP